MSGIVIVILIYNSHKPADSINHNGIPPTRQQGVTTQIFEYAVTITTRRSCLLRDLVTA
jgi:hypothetical protein